ncbi:MAG: hypothetical protein V2J62_06075 [candidate division KSB1 bacterium]|jgi:hypothetical protein|nr:hypothetical protein [candidate division KSB1 bacterium]
MLDLKTGDKDLVARGKLPGEYESFKAMILPNILLQFYTAK